MRFSYCIRFVLLTLLVISCSGKNTEILQIDLSGNDWSIAVSDNPEYALPEISHSEWDTVTLPGNLSDFMKLSNGSLWLRKTFEYNKDFIQENPALYLGRVFERDRVFINGVLIGDNGGKEINFGTKRIYSIPFHLLKEGENVIAIRISSNLSGAAGILSSPIAISSLNAALDDYWKEATREFIYVSFFLFIGLFYFLNFLWMKNNTEYLSFSAFAFIYCIYEFTRNDYRFLLWDNFVFFKFLEYSTLMFIPYFFIRFTEDFFRFPSGKYLKLYLLLNSFFVLLFAFIQNHRFWYTFVGYWDLHLPFALGYNILLTLRKIRQNQTAAYVNLLGLLYIFYAILKQILIERGLINAESSLETSVIFYFFVITLALRLQFLILKMGIQKRYEQLKEADKLRDKVFNHMELMISGNLRKMNSLIQNLLKGEYSNSLDPKNKVEDHSQEILGQIETLHAELQPLMDDIIELSRLEVMNEIPFKTSVPFVDFIKEVIPKNSITYSIRVSPDTMIENSLELINSIVIRLIDFPPIREFSHNDLIITQDLKGNIHLRFLLFHKNPKIAIRIFSELSSRSIAKDSNTVKWQIIQQIARLLDAKLEFKIIKRKYLRIDLELKAVREETPVSSIEPAKNTKTKNRDFKKYLKMFTFKVQNLLKKGK